MTLVRMRVMKTCARRVTRDRAIRRACPHLSISAHNSPARQRGRPILFAAAYCLHRQTSTTTSRSLMSHSATLMGGPPSTADSDYVNEWLPRERTTDRLLCRTWRNVLTKVWKRRRGETWVLGLREVVWLSALDHLDWVITPGPAKRSSVKLCVKMLVPSANGGGRHWRASEKCDWFRLTRRQWSKRGTVAGYPGNPILTVFFKLNLA